MDIPNRLQTAQRWHAFWDIGRVFRLLKDIRPKNQRRVVFWMVNELQKRDFKLLFDGFQQHNIDISSGTRTRSRETSTLHAQTAVHVSPSFDERHGMLSFAGECGIASNLGRCI